MAAGYDLLTIDQADRVVIDGSRIVVPTADPCAQFDALIGVEGAEGVVVRDNVLVARTDQHRGPVAVDGDRPGLDKTT